MNLILKWIKNRKHLEMLFMYASLALLVFGNLLGAYFMFWGGIVLIAVVIIIMTVRNVLEKRNR